MEDIIMPIAICVVLPVIIVYLVTRARINRDNLRAQVLLEALKSNAKIDTSEIVRLFGKSYRVGIERLRSRLLIGCIFTLIGCVLALAGLNNVENESASFYIIAGISASIGFSYLTVYFTSRKQVMAEYEAQQRESLKNNR